MCSHCHTLAPIWRTLAKEMEGVLRFGAVNCEDEWQLCRNLNIRSYPSLYMYPSVSKFLAHVNEDSVSMYTQISRIF